MNFLGHDLIRMVVGFFSGGIREDHDLEVRLRIRVINIISAITILILTFFGLTALEKGKLPLGYFDFSVALIFFITQIYLRKTGNYNHVKYFWVISTGVLFVYLFNTGGIEHTGHLWVYIFPLVAAFLLGARKGAIAISALLAGVIVLWLVDLFQGTAVYSINLVARFLVSFSIISFSACYYEHFRNETLQKLETSNLELDRQIAKLKRAEGALKKNQEELERRVEDRTRELIKSNEELQREIAEHLKTGELLRASEEQYRLVFENSFDVVFSLDDQFRMVSISPSVERILGYKPEELIGRDLIELNLLPPQYVKKAFRQITEVLGGESISSTDYEVIAKDGTVLIVQISGAPIFKLGKVVGMSSIGRDITAQKKAEEVLRQAHDELEIRVQQRTRELERTNEALESANQIKSDFLANMSHELRTPLNHIMGFTELVANKHFGDLNAVQEEYLKDVLQSSEHLLSLINDILDLSKVEAGKLDLKTAEIRLGPLLENSLAMVEAQAGKGRIRLLTEIEDNPDTIQVDERKLKQIVYNLLSNAVKFTPDGGEVTLSARYLTYRDDRWFTREGQPVGLPWDGNDLPVHCERWVNISVRDTGIGIKDEDLKRIFNPFEQVDHSLGRRYQGTGLGLSVSRKLAELHRGRIWAESDGAGKGSRFSFVIPI
ncbi:MAG: ATP-binding protein [Deltaproteobacteria bacterium]|nr:ATP-binding protein [Deltaproteobacteria bacterium]